MGSSVFHVWAIFLLAPNMQNLIVNRFRCRSDAEVCLRLFRREKPGKNYTIMYISLGNILKSIPVDWEMYTAEGNKAVALIMNEIYAALSEHPLPKVRAMLKNKVELVSESHSEIYDTAVRDGIVWWLTKWAREANELSEFDLSSHYWDL